MKKNLLVLLLLPLFGSAQIPQDYYHGTESLSGYALKTKLHDIISKKNIAWHYGDLQNFYKQTDLDIYYDHDATNTTILLDMYSEIPTGPDAYEYTAENMIGSSGGEGQGWNREHMMPQSTFNSNYPMYSDLFFVIPTDAKINQLRSNYPYGKAGTPNYYTFTNGSKISKNGTPGSAYTGRVYEPIDEFKGDIARSILYFAVRYEGKLGSFNFYNGTSPANDTSPLDGTEEKSFEKWFIDLMLQWHTDDPVSQREIDRNNAVYVLQKNRNPFIDYPEWVNSIWSVTADAVPPQAPTNLVVEKTSAYFVDLKWNASPDSDVLGYRIYRNGTLLGSTKSTTLSIDHLTPGTAYSFSVKAYDAGYLESEESNAVAVSTLDTDVYARDLMISKYLEGSANNKAIEIVNRTGHAVDLNKYKLSAQFYNSTADNYYFPAPYELEGMMENNSSIVILNPNANFSCIDNSGARFLTAAPQLTFSGSQYFELRYNSSTIDAIGTRGLNNFDTLGNVSLYRLETVSQPRSSFDLGEWTQYPADYCAGLGQLAVNSAAMTKAKFTLYPNPAVGDFLYINGEGLKTVRTLKITDFSGRVLKQSAEPFKRGNSIDVKNLTTGVYLLQLDEQALKFTKQ